MIRIISGKAKSTCPFAYGFMIKPASQMSRKKPCTNVPISCIFCSESHWKYNIRCHLNERHPTWERAGENKDFRDKIYISRAEERALKVTEDRVGLLVQTSYDTCRTTHNLPSIHDLRGLSPRRTRTQPPSEITSPLPISLPNPASTLSFVSTSTHMSDILY